MNPSQSPENPGTTATESRDAADTGMGMPLLQMAGFLLQPPWCHWIKPQAKHTSSLIMNDAGDGSDL